MHMPGFKVSVLHNLSQEDAVLRLKNVIRDLQNRFADKISNVEQSWSGNSAKYSFEVMGFPVSGSLKIHPEKVQLEGKIPFIALPFKERIEKTIRDQMTTLLS
jgi:hypothetical protein